MAPWDCLQSERWGELVRSDVRSRACKARLAVDVIAYFRLRGTLIDGGGRRGKEMQITRGGRYEPACLSVAEIAEQRAAGSIALVHREINQVVRDYRVRIRKTPLNRRKRIRCLVGINRVIQHACIACVPQADPAVESGSRSEQGAAVCRNKVIADDASVMIDVAARARTGIIRVSPPGPAGHQPKPDAAGIIDQHVALDQRISTASPRVNGVLGKSLCAPKPFYKVVANIPAPGLVSIHAAGITVIPDLRPPRVGQLDMRAGDDPVIGVVTAGDRVDLDRLLPRVDDMYVIDVSVECVAAIGAHHMDGMVVRLTQCQVGNRHMRGNDLGDLGRGVIAIQDHGLPVPTRRSQGHVWDVKPQVLAIEVIGAIGDQDGGALRRRVYRMTSWYTVETFTILPVGAGSAGQFTPE